MLCKNKQIQKNINYYLLPLYRGKTGRIFVENKTIFLEPLESIYIPSAAILSRLLRAGTPFLRGQPSNISSHRDVHVFVCM